MARVRDIEIHEVSEDCQPVYQRFSQEYGPFLNQVKVFAHRPPALKHIMGLLLDLADEALFTQALPRDRFGRGLETERMHVLRSTSRAAP